MPCIPCSLRVAQACEIVCECCRNLGTISAAVSCAACRVCMPGSRFDGAETEDQSRIGLASDCEDVCRKTPPPAASGL